jgi:hypothetical protein
LNPTPPPSCACGFVYEPGKRVCWKCGTRPCETPKCKQQTGSPFLAFCFGCDLRAQEQERQELREKERIKTHRIAQDAISPPIGIPPVKGKKVPQKRNQSKGKGNGKR